MVSKGGIEIFSMGIFSLLVNVSSKLTLILNKYHRIQCKLYLRITVIHPLKNAKVESQPKNWSWHLGRGSIHGKMSIFQIPHSKGPIPAACGKFICHMRGPSERHNGIKVSYSTVKWKESDGWSGRYLEQTRLWFQIPYSECSWKVQKTDQ